MISGIDLEGVRDGESLCQCEDFFRADADLAHHRMPGAAFVVAEREIDEVRLAGHLVGFGIFDESGIPE